MANDDEISARGGLLPVTMPHGNIRTGLYKVTTNATVGFFIGQPVDLDANGGVVGAGVTDAAFLLGSIVGFTDNEKAQLPSSLNDLTVGPSLPANTDGFAIVADDPNQIFQIQEDTGGSALTRSNVGNTAHFVPRTSSGNTTTGYSTAELDRSTAAADTGGSLTILGLVDRMNSDGTDNDFGNFAKLRVKIFQHRLAHSSWQSPAI